MNPVRRLAVAISAIAWLMVGGCARELDASHPGWRDPTCSGCHEADSHTEGRLPFQCAECHGNNGAPPGHAGATPCSECHGLIHGSSEFPDPSSCLSCHTP